MCYREIESGDMMSAAEQLGSVELRTVLYANAQNEMAMTLIDLWQSTHDTKITNGAAPSHAADR